MFCSNQLQLHRLVHQLPHLRIWLKTLSMWTPHLDTSSTRTDEFHSSTLFRLSTITTKVSRRNVTSDSISNSRRIDALPSLDHDPDTFGTLSVGDSGVFVQDKIGTNVSSEIRQIAQEVESIYTPDEADDQLFQPEHRWTMARLQREVFKLLREKKLTEALDLFTETIQDGGFPMNQSDISYICSALINQCAQVGHVEMAFKLFEDMKRRGAKMKLGWYTSLFNACANSPWDASQNLLRIDRLRDHMRYRGCTANQSHYHAMIKAYGRCGAIESAFAVVDEIRMRRAESEENLIVTSETFNFLLQACIADKENGFRHAVSTWQKMMKMKIKPDLYSYNLFLRAIRECSINLTNPKQEKASLKIKSPEKTKAVTGTQPEILLPSPGFLMKNLSLVDLISRNEEDDLRMEREEDFPVVKRSNAELQALLNIPENRLAVLGGIRALTIQLNIHKVKPDIKTITEFVQVVSPAEIPDVLMLVEAHNLKPDIHFFNMIMRKYMRWNKTQDGRHVLDLINEHHLSPNIMTWGILALGATTWLDATQLLKEMDELNIIPNDEIMGAFMLNASRGYDPRYVLRLLEEHIRREIKPSARFVKNVINFQHFIRKAILEVECGRKVQPPKLNTIVQSKDFKKYWTTLKLRFKVWLKEVNVDPEETPWKKDYIDRIERLEKRKFELK